MRNIKRSHTFFLRGKINEKQRKKLRDVLSSLLGIYSINMRPEKGRIKVSYDLKLINYKSIEEKLRKLGLTPAKGPLSLISSNFIKFTEKSEIEQRSIDAYYHPHPNHGTVK